MSNHGQRELAILDQASRMLAEATSLDDVKAIRDKAEAARTYARAAQLGLDLQNRAAELKLRAERKAGEFLTSLKLRGGDRKSKGHRVILKLKDLGISPQQSKRWQTVASVPERDFSEYLRVANELGREVTSAGLVRIARKGGGETPRGYGTAARAADTVSKGSVSMAAPHELIVELMNHCQLLENVLRPVYQGSDVELKRAERRIVGRLLDEMSQLIKQLNKDWQSIGDAPR